MTHAARPGSRMHARTTGDESRHVTGGAAYVWDASRVPWIPDLFSAPELQRVLDRTRQERLAAIPYFAGLMSGETDALIESFSGEPELHHPTRGRVKGARAFARFVGDERAWLSERYATVEPV